MQNTTVKVVFGNYFKSEAAKVDVNDHHHQDTDTCRG